MRPHVIINCAISLDGKLALRTRRQTRISSQEDLKRVQELRASVDAILVGIGTVLADDPGLKVKGSLPSDKKPIRVVLDYYCRIPQEAEVLDRGAPTIVYVRRGMGRELKNAEVVEVNGENGKLDLNEVLQDLYNRGVRKLLVEGGGEVIWSFTSQGLFDEIYVFIGNMIIGGRDAPTMADGMGASDEKEIVKLELIDFKLLEGGILLHYRRGGKWAKKL